MEGQPISPGGIGNIATDVQRIAPGSVGIFLDRDRIPEVDDELCEDIILENVLPIGMGIGEVFPLAFDGWYWIGFERLFFAG